MATAITAETLRDRLAAGEEPTIVDTRPKESFESWRLPGAVQYVYKPPFAFDRATFEAETGLSADDDIVTMCAKGKSSGALAEALTDAGYENVAYVEDGMRAWSGVYDHVDIQFESCRVIQLQRRAKGCLGYVVASDGRAAVIDPTRYTDEFIAAAEGLDSEIVAVFDTHIHADHLSGGRQLASELDVPYYLGERATARGVEYEFEPLSANQTVTIGDVDIKALETPGHTSEMVSYLIGREAVTTGDTIFVDSVGRTELQFGDGDAATGAGLLYDSLHRTLLAEPDAITVLPGHFAVANDGTTAITHGGPVTTTIGRLRRQLAVLQADREAFIDRVTETLPEKPPNYEAIISSNTGQQPVVDETTAIDLELGPNRCAAELDAD